MVAPTNNAVCESIVQSLRGVVKGYKDLNEVPPRQGFLFIRGEKLSISRNEICRRLIKGGVALIQPVLDEDCNFGSLVLIKEFSDYKVYASL
jgi:hypothetical protein